jgi:hypothetical protein
MKDPLKVPDHWVAEIAPSRPRGPAARCSAGSRLHKAASRPRGLHLLPFLLLLPFPLRARVVAAVPCSEKRERR